MIDDLDRSLERLLREKAPLPTDLYDVSFDVPTSEWSNKLGLATVNLYLHDVRENQDLRDRSDFVDELQPDGSFVRRRPPVRLDLFYAVTTWSAAGDEQAVTEEHRLLALVLQTLLRYATLPPEVLQGALVGQEPPLPYLVAQLDGLPQPPAEFWSALGNKIRPAINLMVTIAIEPRAVTDVPDRLLPVESEEVAVAFDAGLLVEAGIVPPLADERQAGSAVSTMQLADAALGALAADVDAAPDEIVVADGRVVAANAWVLLDDGGASEAALVGPRDDPAGAVLPLSPPLTQPHAAGVPVRTLDPGFAAFAVLTDGVARGDTSMDVSDGGPVTVGGVWAIVDDAERTEVVRAVGTATAGPGTVTVPGGFRFGHEPGRRLRLLTAKANGTTLAAPANEPTDAVTLAAAPGAPPAGATPFRIGRGDRAEFGVGTVAGTTVTFAAPLRRNHAAGTEVRALAPGAAVGALVRLGAPGDASVAIAGEGATALARGSVIAIAGAGPSYHELASADETVGAAIDPERRFTIGVRVTDDATPPAPLTGASVLVVGRGLTGLTDASGRLAVSGLDAGTYRLRVAAPGFAQSEKDVVVPAADLDEYDVTLTPA